MALEVELRGVRKPCITGRSGVVKVWGCRLSEKGGR